MFYSFQISYCNSDSYYRKHLLIFFCFSYSEYSSSYLLKNFSYFHEDYVLFSSCCTCISFSFVYLSTYLLIHLLLPEYNLLICFLLKSLNLKFYNRGKPTDLMIAVINFRRRALSRSRIFSDC